MLMLNDLNYNEKHIHLLYNRYSHFDTSYKICGKIKVINSYYNHIKPDMYIRGPLKSTES